MTKFYFTHDTCDGRFIEENASISLADSKEDMIAALLGAYKLEDGEQAWLISLDTSDCWIKTSREPNDDLTSPFKVDECHVTRVHPGPAKYWVSPLEIIYGIVFGTEDQVEYPVGSASFAERVK
jgi:hypothetical protein